MEITSSFYDFIRSIQTPIEYIYCATYTLDLRVLNDNLIKALHGKPKQIIVVQDKAQSQKGKSKSGEIFYLKPKPVFPENKFHAKACLLISENNLEGRKWSAYIGSGNFTEQGIEGEKFDCGDCGLFIKEYSLETGSLWEYQILKDLDEFFKNRITQTDYHSLKLGEPAKHKENISMWLRNTSTKSACEHVKDFVQEHGLKNPQEIRIYTPFLNIRNNQDTIRNSLRANEKMKINIVLNKTTYGKEESQNVHIQCLKNKTDLHAKILLAKYGNKYLFVQGSANFTENGYFKSVEQGGNIEIITLAIHEKDEIDKFINYLKIDEKTKPEFKEILYPPTPNIPIAECWYIEEKNILQLEIYFMPELNQNEIRGDLEIFPKLEPPLQDLIFNFKQKVSKDQFLYECELTNNSLSEHIIRENGKKWVSIEAWLKIKEDNLKRLNGENNRGVPVNFLMPSLNDYKHEDTHYDPWKIGSRYKSLLIMENEKENKEKLEEIFKFGKFKTWPLIDEVSSRLIDLEKNLDKKDSEYLKERLKRIIEISEGNEYCEGYLFIKKLVQSQWEKTEVDKNLDLQLNQYVINKVSLWINQLEQRQAEI